MGCIYQVALFHGLHAPCRFPEVRERIFSTTLELTFAVSECMVDWIKHCFVCKFNSLQYPLYTKFRSILAVDFLAGGLRVRISHRPYALPMTNLSILLDSVSWTAITLYLNEWASFHYLLPV